MALSQQDRIVFSKKVASANDDLTSIDRAKAQILIAQDNALAIDNAHKNLFNTKNTITTAYEGEFSYLDGNVRGILTEADLLKSANMVLGNYFYPVDPTSPPPSIAPNIWTKIKPYALTAAIGKKVNETYATIAPEPASIPPITSDISSIETLYLAIERVTGQTCVPANTIQALAAIHTALANLVTKITNWKTLLINESASIYLTDTNAARQAQSVAAKSNIDTVIIPAINTWLAYADFNPSTGETTCLGFFAYNPDSLGSTKLRATELNVLKTAITTRSAFILTRISQLNSYLGTLSQNLSTGDVTGSGLYFDRYQTINLRLNLLTGSLAEYNSFSRVIQIQEDQKSSIISALSVYSSFIKVAKFTSPATGTQYVQMADASGFSVGEQVYLVSDTQDEIVRNILEIIGNRIKFGQTIPAKYRETDYGRIYKDT